MTKDPHQHVTTADALREQSALEGIAEDAKREIQSWPYWKRAYAEHFLCGHTCRHGNGRQACREVGSIRR